MDEKQQIEAHRQEKGSYRLQRVGAGKVGDEGNKTNVLESAFLDWLPVGFVGFDTELKVVTANRRARELIELGQYIDVSLARGSGGAKQSTVAWREQFQSAISMQQSWRLKEVSYSLEGQSRLLEVCCVPVASMGARRQFAGVVILEDVTAEVGLRRKLQKAEKLATLGRLAAKVAHELNNPMDGMLRYINLALRSLEEASMEKPHEYLLECRRGLMRMVQIVSELLEFSRGTYRCLDEITPVEHIIDQALKSVDTRAAGSEVQVVRNYGLDLPAVRGDNLFQVFCNLIKNALAAMPTGGQLRISTRRGPGETVVAEFRDTGVGFAPADREAIFEPFFTTKTTGKGAGLGLAICRELLERHNGRITAESAPEGGARFTVYVPAEGRQQRGSW